MLHRCSLGEELDLLKFEAAAIIPIILSAHL